MQSKKTRIIISKFMCTINIIYITFNSLKQFPKYHPLCQKEECLSHGSSIIFTRGKASKDILKLEIKIWMILTYKQ